MEKQQVPTAPGVQMPKVHKNALDALARNLTPGEAVHVVIVGANGQVIFGTERRAFVFKKGITAGAAFGSELTVWDYQHLEGVQLHTGMLSGAVVLQSAGHSGTRTSYWNQGGDDPHKAPNKIPVTRPFPPIATAVAQLLHLIDAAHNATVLPAPPPLTPPTQSIAPALIADELRKLAELRDAGVLSEGEFIVAKNRLVNG